MLIDKVTLSPVSNTCKIVMQSNYNTVEKSASPTLIPKVTVTKMPFTHKVILAQWVYTSSETQNKMIYKEMYDSLTLTF
jgi:hypothetical protein